MLASCRTFIPYIRTLPRLWEPVNAVTSVQHQQVRWRKRRTDPKAKSKIGRVREPTPVDPWEKAFFKEKNPHYRTTVRAVRRMFVEELRGKSDETAEGLSAADQAKEDEEEWKRLLEWNDEENAKIAKLREEKILQKAKLREEAKLRQLLKKEELEARQTERMTEMVLREKEASKTFITLETMEAAIEEALDNPKNYNFLISKSGKAMLPEDTAWEQLKERTQKVEEEEQEREQEQADIRSVES